MIESDLNRAPVLQLSYFNKECVLRTVASKSGLDAVLMQKYGDSLYSVTYSSRTLIAAERNYPTSGKECLDCLGNSKIPGLLIWQTFCYSDQSSRAGWGGERVR